MPDGTGNPVQIPTVVFSKRTGENLSSYPGISLKVLGKDATLAAPQLKDGQVHYQTNPFPEFAFDKISDPEYGATGFLSNGKEANPIARYTGIPYSTDFIKDYHLISLFRLADKTTVPGYSGRIKLQFQTPKPAS